MNDFIELMNDLDLGHLGFNKNIFQHQSLIISGFKKDTTDGWYSRSIQHALFEYTSIKINEKTCHAIVNFISDKPGKDDVKGYYLKRLYSFFKEPFDITPDQISNNFNGRFDYNHSFNSNVLDIAVHIEITKTVIRIAIYDTNG